VRISDVLSQVTYRAGSMYRELFRSLEVEYQVAFSVPIDTDREICVAISRHGRDFSNRELDELEALRRPMVALARRSVPADGTPGGPREEGLVTDAVGGGESLTRRRHQPGRCLVTPPERPNGQRR
jgi:hypothetical protein